MARGPRFHWKAEIPHSCRPLPWIGETQGHHLGRLRLVRNVDLKESPKTRGYAALPCDPLPLPLHTPSNQVATRGGEGVKEPSTTTRSRVQMMLERDFDCDNPCEVIKETVKRSLTRSLEQSSSTVHKHLTITRTVPASHINPTVPRHLLTTGPPCSTPLLPAFRVTWANLRGPGRQHTP